MHLAIPLCGLGTACFPCPVHLLRSSIDPHSAHMCAARKWRSCLAYIQPLFVSLLLLCFALYASAFQLACLRHTAVHYEDFSPFEVIEFGCFALCVQHSWFSCVFLLLLAACAASMDVPTYLIVISLLLMCACDV